MNEKIMKINLAVDHTNKQTSTLLCSRLLATTWLAFDIKKENILSINPHSELLRRNIK